MCSAVFWVSSFFSIKIVHNMYFSKSLRQLYNIVVNCISCRVSCPCLFVCLCMFFFLSSTSYRLLFSSLCI